MKNQDKEQNTTMEMNTITSLAIYEGLNGVVAFTVDG